MPDEPEQKDAPEENADGGNKPKSNLLKENAPKKDEKGKDEKGGDQSDSGSGSGSDSGKKKKELRQTNEVAAELKDVAKDYINKLILDIEYFKERKKVFEKLAVLHKNKPSKYTKVIERLVELG